MYVLKLNMTPPHSGRRVATYRPNAFSKHTCGREIELLCSGHVPLIVKQTDQMGAARERLEMIANQTRMSSG